VLLVVVLGARRDPCGTDTAELGLGGPCTRSTDCLPGLLCLGGVCTPPDGGASDGGDARDAHPSEASAEDGHPAD
jgi:hypothetical protein